MTIFAHDATFLKRVGNLQGLHVLLRSNWESTAKHVHVQLRQSRHLFVLVNSKDLPMVAEVVQEANKRHHMRALFIHEDEPQWIPQMLSRADLRTLRNTFVHAGPDVPRRVLQAWKLGAQNELIANVRLVGEHLLVLSCASERLEVAFADVPELQRIPISDRATFEIASDGSYLFWPKADVHLDLSRVRYITDHEYRRLADVRRVQHHTHFGAAVADVRRSDGLRQTDIEGLSARQVRRIEHGAQATMEALKKLSSAHGLKLEAYLSRVAKAALKYSGHQPIYPN